MDAVYKKLTINAFTVETNLTIPSPRFEDYLFCRVSRAAHFYHNFSRVEWFWKHFCRCQWRLGSYSLRSNRFLWNQKGKVFQAPFMRSALFAFHTWLVWSQSANLDERKKYFITVTEGDISRPGIKCKTQNWPRLSLLNTYLCFFLGSLPDKTTLILELISWPAVRPS